MVKEIKRKKGYWKSPIKGFLLAVLIGAIGISYWQVSQPKKIRQDASSQKQVIAYLVYWDKERGFATIQNNSSTITTVSPWAYRIKADGGIELDPASANDAAAIVADPRVQEWKSKGLKVVPSIHNNFFGNWDWQVIHDIINSPSLTQTHINNIVSLVEVKNFDGIDIDYENSNNALDKAAFSKFITDLGTTLHAKGKILSVSVYGKSTDQGYGPWAETQDYAAIGAVADQVRIFLYDYDLGQVGSISPMSWVSGSLNYAKTKISADKIIHGIPFYGMDWPGKNGTRVSGVDITWEKAESLRVQYNSSINWDSASAMKWFTYNSAGQERTVWYADRLSTQERVKITLSMGIGGIQTWRLGGEDPANWIEIQKLHTLNSTATPIPTTIPLSPTPTVAPTTVLPNDTVPPSVLLVSPSEGEIVTKTRKVGITATATDNIKVSLVKFYIDGQLKYTDSSSPYTYVWDTRKITSGGHSVKVEAVDSSGNSAYHQISVTK